VGEDEAPFAVVGLGSSASGLQALSELFAELPADPGMAFVVQHLSPEHRSKLSSILAGSNLMPVLEVEDGVGDGVEVERNKVYVIPPSSFPTIEDGRLHVADQQGGKPLGS
jgi:two-component system CheB/CheR fusion protein